MSIKTALGKVYRNSKLVDIVVVEAVVALIDTNSDIIILASPK
jgi:hypothetical protein